MNDYKSVKYAKDFTFFLRHTNQKKNLIAYLKRRIVKKKYNKRFIDIGAGQGEITLPLSRYFKSIIAIEPNPYLIGLIPEENNINKFNCEIENFGYNFKSDFILLSHITYYFRKESFPIILDLLFNSLIRNGEICIVIQDYKSDFSYNQPDYDAFINYLLKSNNFILKNEKIISAEIVGKKNDIKRIASFFSDALHKKVFDLHEKMNCDQRVFSFLKNI